MTMSTMATAKSGCAGFGCEARDPWPLHHVRQRGGALSRLCTSCVLKSHAGSFCSVCFDLVDGGSLPTRTGIPSAAVVRCSTCASVSHRTCLPNPDLASEFVCASCRSKEGFSYFLKESRSDGKRRMIDVQSAKVLSAAARIAANSMSRAAAVIRADADRKVKEAVMARKRAREMLERVLVTSKKDDGANNGSNAVNSVLPVVMEEPKKKVGKRQGREIEKWMRFHEPIPLATVQGVGETEKTKGTLNLDVKSRVGNARKEEKDRKGTSLASLSGESVMEEKRLAGDGENGPRLPQLNQDALLSRTNPRPIFTGSASTTSLRS